MRDTQSSKPQRQKLLPVHVPWSVDAATPCLRFAGAETELPLEVTFVAEFLMDHDAHEAATATDGQPAIVRPSTIALDDVQGQFQLVKVVFPIGSWLRFSRAHSDGEVIDESRYDWSEVPRVLEVSHMEQFREAFRRRWRESTLCPDPAMYEVEGSEWVTATSVEETFKHYIITGHDAYLEVLAEHWSWKSMGGIKGW